MNTITELQECKYDDNDDEIDDSDNNKIAKKLKSGIFYCWVHADPEPINPDKFIFQFYLYFMDHHDNKRMYKYPFKGSFDQVQSLHKLAHHGGLDYFPVDKLPTLTQTPRSVTNDRNKYQKIKQNDDSDDDEIDDSDDNDNEMMKYFLLDGGLWDKEKRYECCGPSPMTNNFKSFETEIATKEDADTLSYVLCKLFNSRLFLESNKSNNILNAFPEIQDCTKITQLLKRMANEWTDTLLKRSSKGSKIKLDKNIKANDVIGIMTNKDDDQLRELKHLKDMNFNKIVVVYRGIHWAIHFCGDEFLLRVEWIQVYDQNSGKMVDRVKCTLLENDFLGQRLFWYSHDKRSAKELTWRWNTLHKITENVKINGEGLGLAFDKWLQRNPRYCNLSNNCQQFVTHIIAKYFKHEAMNLSQKFASRTANGIILPSLAIDAVMQEDRKMCEMKKAFEQNELKAWLEKMHLIEYYDNFANHEKYSDLKRIKPLKLMEDPDLKNELDNIGIKIEHQVLFLWFIRRD